MNGCVIIYEMLKCEDKKDKGIYIAMVLEEEHISRLLSMMIENTGGKVNVLRKIVFCLQLESFG